jgi:hypothetical protein
MKELTSYVEVNMTTKAQRSGREKPMSPVVMFFHCA